MRRNHFFVLVSVLITLWILVTHYVYLSQPKLNFYPTKSSATLNLQNLESNIYSQTVINSFLIDKFKRAIAMQSIQANREQSLNISRDVKSPFNVHNVSSKFFIDDPVNLVTSNERLEQLVSHSENSIAVIVFACNRVSVSKCLDALLKYRPSKEKFPIIVSQDCNHSATASVIKSYGDQLFYIKQPDQRDIVVPPKEKKFKGYFKIARHYGWALNQTFYKFNFQTAIIVEDDLLVAPDFFEYFLGTYPILMADPTLWCVSAWNDNGKLPVIDINSPELLYRTDFFPGLGWMLTKSLWDELSPKWPHSYWDDWLRRPEQRKERACIRPEVSRTKTFGMVGVSNGLFYEKHLKYIHLNNMSVPFSTYNLTYLIKDNYDEEFKKFVYGSPVVAFEELRTRKIARQGAVRIQYFNKDMFKRTAKNLGLMDDFKSGVPRTSYNGVVSLMYENRRVFLAPLPNWKGYDLSWRR